MSYIALTQLPWRHATRHIDRPGADWCCPVDLGDTIDVWRHWLVSRPQGRWLLHKRDPAAFCAALLALWETGRSAVLPGDDRPDTLSRLSSHVDGIIADSLPDTSTVTPASLAPTPVALSPEAEALVLYTSGSTGEPQMQRKRFDQLEAELANHATLWPLDGGAVISQVSHQHIYGLLTGVLRPLCHNTPLCGDDCRYPEVMAARLDEARAASLDVTLVSSPAQLSRLPDHLSRKASSGPNRIFSSGAPLAMKDAKRAEALLDAPITEIYGSTETGGIAHRRQSHDDVWRPLPGVEIAFDATQLRLRSAFLEHPDAWWNQADHVEPMPNGFRLLGRADRLVKLAGKRVSLSALERDLMQLANIHAVHCIKLNQRDTRLGAVVAVAKDSLPHTRHERRERIEQLQRHLVDAHEAVAIPRYWRFVEALPINDQGKLDHSRLEHLFADLEDPSQPRWLGECIEGPDQRVIHLEVPERLVYLEGHFPDFPLVPGVVMVQWAIEQASASFGTCRGFRGIERLKFQRPLSPGVRFTLRLERGTNTIAFSIDSRDGRHGSGRIGFASVGGVNG